MAKYRVTVPCIALNPFATYVIQAESEEDAIAQGRAIQNEMEEIDGIIYHAGPLDDVLWDEAEAEPIEDHENA